jgi:hypothetical protein
LDPLSGRYAALTTFTVQETAKLKLSEESLLDWVMHG